MTARVHFFRRNFPPRPLDIRQFSISWSMYWFAATVSSSNTRFSPSSSSASCILVEWCSSRSLWIFSCSAKRSPYRCYCLLSSSIGQETSSTPIPSRRYPTTWKWRQSLNTRDWRSPDIRASRPWSSARSSSPPWHLRLSSSSQSQIGSEGQTASRCSRRHWLARKWNEQERTWDLRGKHLVFSQNHQTKTLIWT